MNKIDLFFDKLEAKPLESLSDKYPDYKQYAKNLIKDSGEELTDADVAVNYFRKMFEDRFVGTGRMYHYLTCAIDEKQCENVFGALRGTLSNPSNSRQRYKIPVIISRSLKICIVYKIRNKYR